MLSVACFLLLCCSLTAQTQHKNVFYIGHSICGTTMPNMVDDIAIDAGHAHSFDHQLIWGACLSKSWDQHASANVVGTDSWTALESGNFDVVTLIELIPLTEVINSLPIAGCNYSSTDVAGWFYDLAATHNPEVEVYFVEVWNEFNRNAPTAFSDWKQANNAQLNLYEDVVNAVNNEHNGRMGIIPVRLALQAVADSIEAGSVPGMSSWLELFDSTDVPAVTVHLSDVGNYVSALVYYATIYQASPVGLTHITVDEDGFDYPSPSPAAAAAMQEIVWEVVENYSYARPQEPVGLSSANNSRQETLSIFPNPTNAGIVVEAANDATIMQLRVLEPTGRVVRNAPITPSAQRQTVQLDDLPNGWYLLEVTTNAGVALHKVVKHQAN